VLERLEQLVGDFALLDHALAQSGAVADDEKLHLAAGPAPVEPALQRDFLTDVIFQLIDIHRVVVRHGPVSSLTLGCTWRTRNIFVAPVQP